MAATFATDEARVPSITRIDLEHASELLMDTLQADADKWEELHGLDDNGNLNKANTFGAKQTKTFEPRGVIKHFPIYSLVVSTLLDPYDKITVWRTGLKKMQADVTGRVRGLASFLLFLYSTGLVTILQLLSDDLDTMIVVGRIMTQRHNILAFIKMRKQAVLYIAFKTGKEVKDGMSGLASAIGKCWPGRQLLP